MLGLVAAWRSFSVVVACGLKSTWAQWLQCVGLSSCSLWALLSHNMWDLVPWPRIKLKSSAWECRVLDTGPPGKSPVLIQFFEGVIAKLSAVPIKDLSWHRCENLHCNIKIGPKLNGLYLNVCLTSHAQDSCRIFLSVFCKWFDEIVVRFFGLKLWANLQSFASWLINCSSFVLTHLLQISLAFQPYFGRNIKESTLYP